MDLPFDPFELKVYPSCCQGLNRANAFLDGILFNRIVFYAAQGSEIGTDQQDGYLNKLNGKINEIERFLDFFKPIWDKSNPGFDLLFDLISELKSRRVKNVLPVEKPGELVLLPRSNEYSEYMARKSRLDKWKDDAISFRDIFCNFKDFFDLGLMIDGATHGFEEISGFRAGFTIPE